MHEYIFISKEVAEANIGLRRGQDSFNYAVTKNGEYVTSANSLITFSDILSSNSEIVSLTDDDFPPIVIDYP